MKIALLHYSAPPVVGGVEAVLGQHARLIAEAGHEVLVIAGRGGQFDPRIAFIPVPEIDSLNPKILVLKQDLDQGRVPMGFEGMVDHVESALMETLRDVDVLIAHNVCSLNKNLALTAALHRLSESQPRLKMILWHHDLAWTTPRYQSELHAGYPWDLLRTDWPKAVQIVVSSLRQYELSELFGISLKRIRIVPNGLDVASFLKLSNQTRNLVERAGIQGADPLLLLPVRITRRKNIELAIQIAAELHNQFPQVRLVVTGPPGPHNPSNAEYFARLKEQRTRLELDANVAFLAEYSDTYLPDEVIADLYRLADVLLLPSREEGFGIPILEAGLSRLPVFCADISSLRELGGDLVSYFSPDADPNQVATQIGDLLRSDPVHCLRRRVIDQFTWEAIYRSQIAPLLEEK